MHDPAVSGAMRKARTVCPATRSLVCRRRCHGGLRALQACRHAALGLAGSKGRPPRGCPSAPGGPTRPPGRPQGPQKALLRKGPALESMGHRQMLLQPLLVSLLSSMLCDRGQGACAVQRLHEALVLIKVADHCRCFCSCCWQACPSRGRSKRDLRTCSAEVFKIAALSASI